MAKKKEKSEDEFREYVSQLTSEQKTDLLLNFHFALSYLVEKMNGSVNTALDFAKNLMKKIRDEEL